MLYQELIDEVKQLERNYDEIYVYGAGFWGKEMASILTRNGFKISGFVVTKPSSLSETMGLPILGVEKILDRKKTAFVIGVNNVRTKEIIEFLHKKNVDFSRVVDGGKYLTKNRGSVKLQDFPVLEITLVMGCAINCRYCPQKLMVDRYYENEHKRERIMKKEDFELFLKQIPNDCIINFAGMSEPFIHPQCIEFLEMACNDKRVVYLYTTLEGATDSDVDRLLKLPIEYVCFHAADEMGYAHITTSEAYYNRVQRLLVAVKADGSPFVQSVSAQAKPTERILEMCKGKYEVLVSLHDRCGQLEGDELAKRDSIPDGEEIGCAFCGAEVNSHVVLPDGTMLLCNMDYGLNHVIGNLKENTYDEIHNGVEMQRIRKGMMGDSSIELLCRKCVCSTSKKR